MIRSSLVLFYLILSGLCYAQSNKDSSDNRMALNLIETPSKEYQVFISDHKAGLLRNDVNSDVPDPQKVVLQPIYDFIWPANVPHVFYVVQDGEIWMTDVSSGKVVSNKTRNSIQEIGTDNNGTAAIRIDGKQVYPLTINDQEAVQFMDVDTDPSYWAVMSSVKMIDGLIIQAKFDNYKIVAVLDENGYEQYDELGNAIMDTVGGVHTGLFGLEQMNWLDLPDDHIFATQNGYCTLKKDRIAYLGKDLSVKIEPKRIDELTTSDTLMFLPEGATVFKSIESASIYYQVDGKMGVYKLNFDFPMVGEVLEAKYDYVSYSETIDKYISYRKGIFNIHPYNPDHPISIPVPITTSCRIYTKEDYGDDILEIDDQYYFKRQYEYDRYDRSVETWVMTDAIGHSNHQLEFSLEKISEKHLVQNVNTLAFHYNYDEYGEMFYDEYGNEQRFLSGQMQGGLFLLNEHKWLDGFHARIKVLDQGFFVSERVDPAFTDLETELYNEQFEQITQLFASQMEVAGDLILVTTADGTGSIDLNGNTILPFSKEHTGIEYRDGFYFIQGGPLVDEYGDYMYDEVGNEMYQDMLLKDRSGKKISLKHQGEKLLNNGILVITSPGDNRFDRPIGFYDLNSMKVVAHPMYEEITPVQNNTVWLKQEGEWNLYTVGSRINRITKTGYDNIEVSMPADMVLSAVYRGKKRNYLRAQGQPVLSEQYHFEMLHKIQGIEGTECLVKVTKGDRSGIFDLKADEFIVEPNYDSILWNQDGYIEVIDQIRWNTTGEQREITSAKYGLTHEDSLVSGAKIKWLLRPGSPEKAYVKGQLLYFYKNGKQGISTLRNEPLVPAEYSWSESFFRIDLEENWRYDEYGYPIDQTYFDPNYFRVANTVDGKLKYGVYDSRKGLIVPLKYDGVDIGCNNSTCLVLRRTEEQGFPEGMKIGLWDLENGKLITEPRYQNIQTASDENKTYWVIENNRYGIMDSSGKIVFPPSIDNLGETKNNIVEVSVKGKVGAFDLNSNRFKIAPKYDFINWKYGHSNQVVEIGDLFGLIHMSTGKELLPAIYSDVQYAGGAYICQKDKHYSLYDPKRQQFRINEAVEIRKYSNHIFVRYTDKIELLDRLDLTVKFTSDCEDLQEIDYDWYAIMRNGKKGLLNNELKEICPPVYDVIEGPYKDVFIVGNKNPWAYMDHNALVGAISTDGQPVVEMTYDRAVYDWNTLYFYKGGKRYIYRDGKLTAD